MLYVGGENHWINGKRIDNPNTHGTGCTFSSAIACNLALTSDKVQAVTNAKEYLAGAIAAKLDLGKGTGHPVLTADGRQTETDLCIIST